MSVAISNPAAQRRFDIDWLRLAALGLLVVYHVLCVFDSRPFLTKSDFAGTWADGPVALLAPWRMSMVFFIGGVASRFLLEKLDVFDFVRDRALRLIIPFVVAVTLLVPPQIYVQLLEARQAHFSYWDFWSNRAWDVVEYHGLKMPAFGHAWFLPYLFAYAVGAALVWTHNRGLVLRARALVERAPVWLLAASVGVLFVLMDAVIGPTHARSVLVFTDVTGHLRFAPLFALGFLIARSDLFWSKLVAARSWLLGLGVALTIGSYACWLWIGPANGMDATLMGVRAVFGAAVLFGVLAWGAALLNNPSKLLAYASDAILPIYLLHQTLLVLAAYYFGANHWPIALEFAFLLVVSIGGSLAIYQTLIRHSTFMRLLFGLRLSRRDGFKLAAPAPVTTTAA